MNCTFWCLLLTGCSNVRYNNFSKSTALQKMSNIPSSTNVGIDVYFVDQGYSMSSRLSRRLRIKTVFSFYHTFIFWMPHRLLVSPAKQLQSYGAVQLAVLGHPGYSIQSWHCWPFHPRLHLQIGEVMLVCAKAHCPCPLTQAGVHFG